MPVLVLVLVLIASLSLFHDGVYVGAVFTVADFVIVVAVVAKLTNCITCVKGAPYRPLGSVL